MKPYFFTRFTGKLSYTAMDYFAFSMVLILSSCINSGPSANSTITSTGWEINDADWGGFHANTEYGGMEAPPNMVFVEGGTFTKGSFQDNVIYDWNAVPVQQHVSSFFIDEAEVTNISYREYLYWLKKVFPPAEDRFRYIYSSQVPDTLVWRSPLSAIETYVSFYFRHPAFNHYPVVGVNWLQATKFCKWRTDRVNEAKLIELGVLNNVNSATPASEEAEGSILAGENHFNTETYLRDPSVVFSGQSDAAYNEGLPSYTGSSEEVEEGSFVGRHVGLSDGVFYPQFRLPTESEWEYAAVANVQTRYFNTLQGKKSYPWIGSNVRPEEKSAKGDFLANFKRSQGDYGGIAGWANDGASYTAEVKSFRPNDYGLYDMSGNVAEWVADVYRPFSGGEQMEDLNYFRGNVFTKAKYNEDGTPAYISDEVDYDTLINGSIVAKNLPGTFGTENIDEEDTFMKPNYSRSDNINYGDGDVMSSRHFSSSKKNSKYRMYNSPRTKVEVTEDGKIKGQYDKSSRRYTLVSDKVRVYKGGSWKDRAYYLSPGQRKFLHQDRSTSYIGFRCAMSNLGADGRTRTETHGSLF